MKITVEISDSELREIRRVTGERKKGPAIRTLVVDALRLKKRARLAEKLIAGKGGVELAGYEEGKRADKAKAQQLAKLWRE